MGKTAGPNASPLADWHSTPLMGTCLGERLLAGTIVFSTAGAISAVSGVGISAVTVSTGVYRVYTPKCTQMCIQLTYGTQAVFANLPRVSTVSPTSGYFDLLIASAAALSAPSSGDFVHMTISARSRKAVS